MALEDFLKETNDAVKTVLNSSFEIEVYDTKTVPRFDDSLITFDNLDESKKKCKRLESCVLYVDIRNSAAISSERQHWTLARLYSAFVRSMIKAAKYHGGHVRNIIGDRVMVVFDQENCFTNAVNTAILMNSISQYIIDKNFSGEFKCGIGIDYGKMLVTKAGETRRGAETEFYRSLVWLGRPANIASRLTDLANKSFTNTREEVHVGNYYKHIKEWLWMDKSYNTFLDELETTHSPMLRHKDENFSTFFKYPKTTTTTYPEILMSQAVYDGFKAANPKADSIENGWWKEQSVSIKEYSGKVYGGGVVFIAAQELK